MHSTPIRKGNIRLTRIWVTGRALQTSCLSANRHIGWRDRRRFAPTHAGGPHACLAGDVHARLRRTEGHPWLRSAYRTDARNILCVGRRCRARQTDFTPRHDRCASDRDVAVGTTPGRTGGRARARAFAVTDLRNEVGHFVGDIAEAAHLDVMGLHDATNLTAVELLAPFAGFAFA